MENKYINKNPARAFKTSLRLTSTNPTVFIHLQRQTHTRVKIQSRPWPRRKNQSWHPAKTVAVSSQLSPISFTLPPTKFVALYSGQGTCGYLMENKKTHPHTHCWEGHSQHLPASVWAPVVISHCSHPCDSCLTDASALPDRIRSSCGWIPDNAVLHHHGLSIKSLIVTLNLGFILVNFGSLWLILA